MQQDPKSHEKTLMRQNPKVVVIRMPFGSTTNDAIPVLRFGNAST